MFSKTKINRLPDSPGVYFFLGRKNRRKSVSNQRKSEILYIGKASSLQNRVKSYFGKNLIDSRGFLIKSLISKIKEIKYQTTDSVLEALILEANLIKKHQPKYNTEQKDDKSFNYVVITDEDFPRVLLERGKDLKDGLSAQALNLKSEILNLKSIYGPYPHGGQLKEALKIIRRIFPFRSQKTKNTNAELFYQELGLSPKTDTAEARKDYQHTIRHLKLFFDGKKKTIVKQLETEMRVAAKKQNFEKASELRNKIFALKHIQDVSLIKHNHRQGESLTILLRESASSPRLHQGFGGQARKSAMPRIEAYDIAHIMGKFVVGAMIVMENGEFKKNGYRKFKIKVDPGINDIKALKEILRRRLNHSDWPLPNLIAVDGGVAQKRAAEDVLKEKNLKIPVAAVIKDEKHRPKHILGDNRIIEPCRSDILQANAESHRFAVKYHQAIRDRID